MEAELRRFNDVASKSASPAIIRIRSRFTSSKALANCGALVYRDVLDGFCPGTLDDVFAFASLSYAMSRILVRQKRMEEAQVLSDVQRLRNYIDNVDERSIFDTLASKMWSTTSTAAEMYRLSGDALGSGDTGILSASLEEDALNLTERIGQEYYFAALRRPDGGNTYTPPKGTDPREVSNFCPPGQPIPGYNPPPFYTLPLRGPPTATHPSLGSQTPLRPPVPTSSPIGAQPVYHFKITDKVFDYKALNLRNTIAFLAISAFASDPGDGFYLLSGSGKTARPSRTGSVGASERSKIEKKLRRELFDPLKKGGTDDAGFLALLAVAKKFVVLGLLETKEEVQDFLITIAKVR